MKTTKSIYFALYVIAVILLFFGHEFQSCFPPIWKVTAVVGLIWLFLLVNILLFTYHWQKRVYLVGIKGQRELKEQIGLKRLGVNFKDYRQIIYDNRFNSNKNENQAEFVEQYITRTKIKHVLSVILFSGFYSFIIYYIMHSGFMKIAVPILSFIILIIIIDFSVIRIRYEESIFKSKLYNAEAKELMSPKEIHILNNEIINNVIQIHDYYQIYTSKTIINIYNPFYIQENRQHYKNNFEKLKNVTIGHTISSTDYKTNLHFTITLDSNVQIIIHLEPEFYTTPEAFQITSKINDIIIVE